MCEKAGGKILTLLDVSIPGGGSDGQFFCFTQTLKLRKLTPEDQFDSTWKQFTQACVDVFGKVTAVAELHESGDVHYHGFIKWDDSLLATTVRWKKMSLTVCGLGFYKIKVCQDYPGWCTYIRKDIEETCRILNRSPILRDDFEVFKEFGPAFYVPKDVIIVRQSKKVSDCFIKSKYNSRVVAKRNRAHPAAHRSAATAPGKRP